MTDEKLRSILIANFYGESEYQAIIEANSKF
jgi:hypothetical protein